MHVSELLLRAREAGVDHRDRVRLLRQAEWRGLTDARAFLLQLPKWDLQDLDKDVVWRLRALWNDAMPNDRLWVPVHFMT